MPMTPKALSAKKWRTKRAALDAGKTEAEAQALADAVVVDLMADLIESLPKTPATVVVPEDGVHQAFHEKVTAGRWRAYCDSCGWDLKVTRSVDGLNLEETANKARTEHQGKVYYQPGGATPIDARDLKPGDQFAIDREDCAGLTFKFTGWGRSEKYDTEWIDCRELERTNKGWTVSKFRSFRPALVVSA